MKSKIHECNSIADTAVSKTKNVLWFSLLLVAGLISCKKDKDEAPAPASTPPPPADYSPMTTGSYWVYNTYTLDTNGVETYYSTDSCYVSGDTIIGGNTYAVFHGSMLFGNSIYCMRDSSGYLVDQLGQIHFSATNFSDTLRINYTPGFYISYAQMVSPPSSISVPAGAFTAYDCRVTVNITQPGYLWDTTRYTHHYYANGVGLVNESMFFLSSPDYLVRKLMRYHIQ